MNLKTLPSYENETRGYIGWNPYGDYMCDSSNWGSRLEYNTWEDFYSEFKNCDDDLNVIVNFYFCYEDEDKKDSPINLNLWLLHPRKGASRGIAIKSVNNEDLPQIKEYLKRQFETINRWFSWVVK